jgi:16S rRNA (cytidine1402-2'-O)-methyltransferase
MPTLSIVATPIGNLQDITFRAVETLKTVDVILCEDTRVTKRLLDHYGIKTSVKSYHQHSPERVVREIKELLNSGKNLALVSDAGTPGISDPGNKLIHDLARNPVADFQVVGIPGAAAAIVALSISGFPTDKFFFLGFPPHKNKRNQFFKMVTESEFTSVFYESGHRILKCLGELATVLDPKRQVVVCRELTKMFETTYRGTAIELAQTMKEERGEFVVVVDGK